MIRDAAWDGQALLGYQSKAGGAEEPWTEDEFRQVFLEHYGRVTAVLQRLLGDTSRAEELANQVFWKLYQERISRNRDGNLGGWLYRTATNLGIDALRSAGRRKRYEQAARSAVNSGAASDPLKELLLRERQSRVRGVLASLPPAHARILILRASGFSYRELAETLKVRAGSVGTMLIRAEVKFRERYLKLYGREEVL